MLKAVIITLTVLTFAIPVSLRAWRQAHPRPATDPSEVTSAVAAPEASSAASPKTASESDANDTGKAAAAPRAALPEDLASGEDDGLATASLESLADAIAQLDSQLDRDRAIERLNSGEVSAEERTEYGVRFERLARLRQAYVEKGIESVRQALAEYETGHQQRVVDALAQSGE